MKDLFLFSLGPALLYSLFRFSLPPIILPAYSLDLVRLILFIRIKPGILCFLSGTEYKEHTKKKTRRNSPKSGFLDMDYLDRSYLPWKGDNQPAKQWKMLSHCLISASISLMNIDAVANIVDVMITWVFGQLLEIDNTSRPFFRVETKVTNFNGFPTDAVPVQEPSLISVFEKFNRHWFWPGTDQGRDGLVFE